MAQIPTQGFLQKNTHQRVQGTGKYKEKKFSNSWDNPAIIRWILRLGFELVDSVRVTAKLRASTPSVVSRRTAAHSNLKQCLTSSK